MTGCTVVFSYRQYVFLKKVLRFYDMYLDLLCERLEAAQDVVQLEKLISDGQKLIDLQDTINRYY